jgi:heterotetrameric sarcosine oxidase gamma subunit
LKSFHRISSILKESGFVANLSLSAKSPLGGTGEKYAKEHNGVAISEITSAALVSIATPNGGEEALAEAISKAYSADLPQVGLSTVSADGKVRFLGMQRDQLFVLFDYQGDEAVAQIAEKLGPAGYYSDQSDSWLMLKISGPECRHALARICSLDLHLDVFAEGAVARTVMEHLGAIILRDGADSFVLMSARSSAKSFLHAVETSIQNIL